MGSALYYLAGVNSNHGVPHDHARPCPEPQVRVGKRWQLSGRALGTNECRYVAAKQPGGGGQGWSHGLNSLNPFAQLVSFYRSHLSRAYPQSFEPTIRLRRISPMPKTILAPPATFSPVPR